MNFLKSVFSYFDSCSSSSIESISHWCISKSLQSTHMVWTWITMLKLFSVDLVEDFVVQWWAGWLPTLCEISWCLNWSHAFDDSCFNSCFDWCMGGHMDLWFFLFYFLINFLKFFAFEMLFGIIILQGICYMGSCMMSSHSSDCFKFILWVTWAFFWFLSSFFELFLTFFCSLLDFFCRFLRIIWWIEFTSNFSCGFQCTGSFFGFANCSFSLAIDRFSFLHNFFSCFIIFFSFLDFGISSFFHNLFDIIFFLLQFSFFLNFFHSLLQFGW